MTPLDARVRCGMLVAAFVAGLCGGAENVAGYTRVIDDVLQCDSLLTC